MDQNQRLRAKYRKMPKGYYHLCTDGKLCKCLFYCPAHFAFVINTLAIIAAKYDVIIYAYEVMPSHLHLLVSCTGNTCVEIFDFLMRRIVAMLEEDGYPRPPEEYYFKLIPIENAASMRSLYVYLARNPYEKGYCLPTSYRWGTGRLAYSNITDLIKGKKVSEFSRRELSKLLRSKEELPGDWLINPEIGVLPQCFVNTGKFYELFPTAKQWLTMLVKDYEASIHIAKSVDEDMEFSDTETDDIVNNLVTKEFRKASLSAMTTPELLRLAGLMHSRYNMKAEDIAATLGLPLKVISQSLRSKDYGVTAPSPAPPRSHFSPKT